MSGGSTYRWEVIWSCVVVVELSGGSTDRCEMRWSCLFVAQEFRVLYQIVSIVNTLCRSTSKNQLAHKSPVDTSVYKSATHQQWVKRIIHVEYNISKKKYAYLCKLQGKRKYTPMLDSGYK